MRILGGYQDTRTNKEDFALTPYLFGVYVNGKIIKVYGIGFCWGWISIFIGIGFNIPKNHPTFTNITIKNTMKKLLIIMMLVHLSITAQTNPKTEFIGFYGAIDLKNAMQGSEPTNGQPSLDFILGTLIPIGKSETSIGVERFAKINFTKFFTTVGYHVKVHDFDGYFKELSINPAIEGSVIWRSIPETIQFTYDGITYNVNQDKKVCPLSYGLNLSIRQEIGDNWAIESFSNYSYRPDIEQLYPDGKKDYRYSHYLKIIYKLNI